MKLEILNILKNMMKYEGLQRPLSYINLSKPTGHVMQQQVLHSTTVRSAHTVFICFVFI